MVSYTSPVALLRWYLEAGVDVVIDEVPIDRFFPLKIQLSTTTSTSTLQTAPHLAGNKNPITTQSITSGMPLCELHTAAELAARCMTLDDLRTAVSCFNGCSLKVNATNTVFADGIPTAHVMVIGEAPGIEEDQQGIPFIGPSGRLLDRMLGSIGLDRRHNCYITNVVPWRPPANRKPTLAEVSMLLPFLERHIALVAPLALLLVGGLAASVVLARQDGIMKLRGQWLEYSSAELPYSIPAIATFHPAYLLRSPAQKRLAWRDLLALRSRLEKDGRTRDVFK